MSNDFGQTEAHAGNSTFAIGGVSCSADSFVVKESAVLRMKNCAEKPAHRKSAKRWQKILTSVVGKSLADRKLNLARKLKKRLAF